MTRQTQAHDKPAEVVSTISHAKARNKLHPREALTGYLLLAPALIGFFVFMIIPIVMTIGLSFVEWSGITLNSMKFIGLDNYREMFADATFWLALKNNFVFVILGMTASVILGLVVAVLLEQQYRGSNTFRGMFFLPTVLSLTVVGIIFGFMLSPEFGVIGPVLSIFGVAPADVPALLANPDTVLYTLVAVECWRTFGFAMFLFVAGLKVLDQSLVEAARIDGASGWGVFWHITLPQLRPVTIMVSTLVGIGMMRLFDLVYVMTAGGPGDASQVLVTYSYYEGFSFNRVGFGATLAMAALAITFVLTILRFKFLPDERREAKGDNAS